MLGNQCQKIKLFSLLFDNGGKVHIYTDVDYKQPDSAL